MSEEVIRTEDLVMRYGDTTALGGVSVAIRGPGLVGILGPNGAGKTTLLDVLEGVAEPTSGRVLLFESEVTPRRYPRRKVGTVLQREFVLDHVTVREYADLFAAIYEIDEGGEGIVERARLADRRNVAMDRLSGGEVQRLFIAAATVHEPPLLFLDEPTSQLDPENKARIGDWLRELAKTTTIVMATHDLAEAERVCDELLFITGGLKRAQGTKAELLAAAGGAGTLADAFFFLARTRIDHSGEARA